MPNFPKIAVLLATYNGESWLEAQIESILAQDAVEPTIFFSDDMSTDTTRKILAKYANRDNVVDLTSGVRHGSSTANFLHLMLMSPLDGFDYFALSDQDDIWLPRKLERAVDLMRREAVDGYSSNVTAVWPDGRRVEIDKAQAQRRLDHLFEAAGPGCTYVVTRALHADLQAYMRANPDQLRRLRGHDWFMYAYARENGFDWHIDRCSTLLYRQHCANELGVNIGWQAAYRRLQSIRSGKFYVEVRSIVAAVQHRSWVSEALERFSWRDRLRLFTSAGAFRRRLRDRWALRILFLAMGRR